MRVNAIFARQAIAKHNHEIFGIGYIYAGAQKSASGRGMVEAVASIDICSPKVSYIREHKKF